MVWKQAWIIRNYRYVGDVSEANPDKIKAVEAIQTPPRQIKYVQHLNSCLAALGHFISRLGERAMPLFGLLKKKGPGTGRAGWLEKVSVHVVGPRRA